MPRISETLDGAARIIGRGWVQGACAIDKNGNTVAPCSPDAVAWDLFGAIERASGGSPDQVGTVLTALRWIGSSRRRFKLVAMNDKPGRRPEAIVRYLRHAAAIIERDEDPCPK